MAGTVTDTQGSYRCLAIADANQAARVIAEAFVDDPLCAFMLPARRSRTSTLYRFFRAMSSIAIKAGLVFGVGQPLQGVAFWEFPGQASLSISVSALGPFLPLLFSAYPIGLIRARGIIQQQKALREQYAAEAHYYLDNIGVIESARGQGLSSHLIRPVLEEADSRGMMVYTDTVTASNVPLYEHFGFVNVEARSIPATGITVWALRRPASG